MAPANHHIHSRWWLDVVVKDGQASEEGQRGPIRVIPAHRKAKQPIFRQEFHRGSPEERKVQLRPQVQDPQRAARKVERLQRQQMQSPVECA